MTVRFLTASVEQFLQGGQVAILDLHRPRPPIVFDAPDQQAQ